MTRLDRIKKYREEGMTFHEIGKILKISRQRVQQIFIGIPKYVKKPKLMGVCVVCKETRFVSKHLICGECRGRVLIIKGRDRTREIVRIRDGHRCQNKECSKQWVIGQRKFDVHHLNGACGKMTRKYDSIKDISGMITLCHGCHFNHPEHSQVKKRLDKKAMTMALF